MRLRPSLFAGAVALAVLLALLLGLFDLLPRMEGVAYDLRVQSLPVEQRDPRILVVGIDDRSIGQLGPFPWRRRVHARLLEVLRERGARAVFFDLLFDGPGAGGPEDDQAFAEALRATGIGVLACRVGTEGSQSAVLVPPTLLPVLQEAAPMASINRRTDEDGAVRWGVLAVDGKGLEAPVPSASLVLFADLLGVDRGQIRYGPRDVQVGSVRVPTSGPFPHDIPIRFRRASPPLSYQDLLAPGGGPPDLAGKVILVGDMTSDDRMDTFTTPVGRMKGIEIHACFLDTLLSGRILRRAPPWADYLAVVALVLGVGFALQRFRLGVGLLAGTALAAVYVVVNFALFRYDLWLALVQPLLAAALTPMAIWAARSIQARQLIGQFVAGHQVDRMLVSDEARDLGGEAQVATVFFTDIRGYTTLSESRSPVEVMDILNQYHSRVGEIYARRGGQVMTYQGDAQIVLFGYGRRSRGATVGESVAEAVRAGLEMQDAVQELRGKWSMGEGERFEVGVGICTGTVSVAVVGSEGHKQHTVLGDVVRLASEVQGQSANLEAPVLLDAAAYEAAEGRVVAEATMPVTLKGVAEPVVLYRALEVR